MNTSRSRSKVFALFVTAVVFTSIAGAWGAPTLDPLALGRQYTSWFYAGETDRIWPLLSPEMRKLMGSAGGLENFSNSVIQQFGMETKVLAEHTQPTGTGAVIYERIATFSEAPSRVLIQWTVGSDGTVTGLIVRPVSQEMPAPVRLFIGASGRKEISNESLAQRAQRPPR